MPMTEPKPPRPKGAAPGAFRRPRGTAADVEKMSIHMDPDLATRLRVHCAERRLSLSGAIEQAVREMLDRA
jgi:hypothetical protein